MWFLVVADGAKSKIRTALRPDGTLDFAAALCLAGTYRKPDGLPAIIQEDFGVAVDGDGHNLFVSPIHRRSAVWSVGYLISEPSTPPHGDEALRRQEEVMTEALERGKAFAEPVQSLVRATGARTLMIFSAIDKAPVNHSEHTGRRPVFIGEAHHAVSPFAGNGANMALMNGIDLAGAPMREANWTSAVATFDAESIPRSKGAIQQSHSAIRVAHSKAWSWFW